VRNVAKTLTSTFGFAASRIKTLTDFGATKKAMQTEVKKLVDGAKRGDVIVLHYSGHGSNCPDKNGDEADARDEILCPTDLDWYDPLTDDWLRRVFNGLAAGVNFTCLMDCCHSGSNTRAILPPDAKVKERFLPNPLDLIAAESGRRLRGNVRGGLVAKPRKAKGDVVAVNIAETLITGCRDDQTSADAYIAGSFNGAMTYALCRAIARRNGKLTYRELHREMLAYLKGKYSQVPQLEGRARNLDRRFLEPL
jgi:hypothetical protein